DRRLRWHRPSRQCLARRLSAGRRRRPRTVPGRCVVTALLWGLPGDPTMTLVRRGLGRLGVPFLFLEQRQVLPMTVELSVGPTVEGLLRVDGTVLDLASVAAAYLRPHDSTRVSAVRDTPPG